MAFYFNERRLHILSRCTGEQYLDYLGIEYSTWGLWENHVALTAMMLLFLIIAYLKLRYIKKFS